MPIPVATQVAGRTTVPPPATSDPSMVQIRQAAINQLVASGLPATQENLNRMIEQLGADPSGINRSPSVIDELGYTGTASVPIPQEKPIQPGNPEPFDRSVETQSLLDDIARRNLAVETPRAGAQPNTPVASAPQTVPAPQADEFVSATEAVPNAGVDPLSIASAILGSGMAAGGAAAYANAQRTPEKPAGAAEALAKQRKLPKSRFSAESSPVPVPESRTAERNARLGPRSGGRATKQAAKVANPVKVPVPQTEDMNPRLLQAIMRILKLL